MTHVSAPKRQRLPNRRDNRTETLEIAGQRFHVCIGLCPETGQPREVFLNGGKEGSQFDAMLADAATCISVALQFGVPIHALAKSVGRAPDLSTVPGSLDQLNAGSLPATAIGAALDLLIAYEPRPGGEPNLGLLFGACLISSCTCLISSSRAMSSSNLCNGLASCL